MLLKLILDWAGPTMLQAILGMFWLPRHIHTTTSVVRNFKWRKILEKLLNETLSISKYLK
jgi:hypothetical protein